MSSFDSLIWCSEYHDTEGSELVWKIQQHNLGNFVRVNLSVRQDEADKAGMTF